MAKTKSELEEMVKTANGQKKDASSFVRAVLRSVKSIDKLVDKAIADKAQKLAAASQEETRQDEARVQEAAVPRDTVEVHRQTHRVLAVFSQAADGIPELVAVTSLTLNSFEHWKSSSIRALLASWT